MHMDDTDGLQALQAEVKRLRLEVQQLRHSNQQPSLTESDVSLSAAQAERYARHITLNSFGPYGAPLRMLQPNVRTMSNAA